MNFVNKTIKASISRPILNLTIIFTITILLATIATLPSLWPEKFPTLNAIKVDTDPENMLPSNEPVRVFHNEMKKKFSLNEIIVVGVVNPNHPNGVFNTQTLKKIYDLTEYAKTLTWEEGTPPQVKGVISVDILAPSMVDNISQGEEHSVKFEWLMSKPPTTREECEEIRIKAQNLPFLNGTLVAENGKALALYLPITSKDISYKIYQSLNQKIKEWDGEEVFHITGLPVANDTFGKEMFIQMAISAPAAMLVIFLILFFYFRKLSLILSPMILALVSVIVTMSTLIISGNTIHIMSSMIPIFIMPIAVLDSVHILSEFFDLYPHLKSRKKTIFHVMETLFFPMFYTSLTSIAGFASLALTPIPPVQVFGIFVALGVLTAWVLTILFIPAYIMVLPEKFLKGFGKTPAPTSPETNENKTFLNKIGHFSFKHGRLILLFSFIMTILALIGIKQININDNPVKWFKKNHPIRKADTELNKHFGGTYMAYLSLKKKETSFKNSKAKLTHDLNSIFKKLTPTPVTDQIKNFIFSEIETYNGNQTMASLFSMIIEKLNDKTDSASDEDYPIWSEVTEIFEQESLKEQTFKDPNFLRFISQLQSHILETGVVGKSNSIADIVKTVHREILSGEEKDFRIPNTPQAVAQCLITYQNSHREQDLWHFVTPDYQETSLWVQMKSGNNKDMIKVVDSVRQLIDENSSELNLEAKWFGLTYINVVWQQKMVAGMLKAFLGSFLVVFLMMTILFKSASWGFISMIPLTVTIGFIYGSVGFMGKDYDMPIAVLSSLTLGLAVDFAIHFLARSKELYQKHKSWEATIPHMFQEPAQAIKRNIVVIALGFLPLLAAPLVPYITVGAFLATILTVAGLTTLFILPAILGIFEKHFFSRQNLKLACRWQSCAITCISFALVLYINFQDYLKMTKPVLTLTGLCLVIISLLFCRGLASKSNCQSEETQNVKTKGE